MRNDCERRQKEATTRADRKSFTSIQVVSPYINPSGWRSANNGAERFRFSYEIGSEDGEDRWTNTKTSLRCAQRLLTKSRRDEEGRREAMVNKRCKRGDRCGSRYRDTESRTRQIFCSYNKGRFSTATEIVLSLIRRLGHRRIQFMQ